MKLFFTPQAERQAMEKDAWWREHRPGVPELFAEELAEVLNLIIGAPSVGARYTTKSGVSFRRVLMPKTKNHVYFDFEETLGLVIVHAVWGAPRGRGPALK